MWEHSFLSPLGDRAKRCGYCGKFCALDHIDRCTGICNTCKATMAEDGEKGINTAEVIDDSKSESPLSSPPDEIHHEEDAIEQDNDTAERSDDAHTELSEPGEGNASAGENDTADKDDLMAGQLCGRCWEKPASRTLYSCPTCDDCVAVAKSERANKTGKQRFQPKNPKLPPGKRLTKVCDACRAKRKRCPHREVVDASDPRVIQRKRKSTNMAKEAVDGSASENDDTSSDEMEVDPPVPEDDAAGASPGGSNSKAPSLGDGPSDSSMRLAIQRAVKTIYQRQLRGTVKKAEEKAEEANERVQAILYFMSGWTARYGEDGLEVDEEGMERVREVLESARAALSSLLEELSPSNNYCVKMGYTRH